MFSIDKVQNLGNEEGIKHAKTQVGATFHVRDFLGNVLLKFLVLETPYCNWCPLRLGAVTPGSQKQTEISVTKVCYQAKFSSRGLCLTPPGLLWKREFVPQRTHKHIK